MRHLPTIKSAAHNTSCYLRTLGFFKIRLTVPCTDYKTHCVWIHFTICTHVINTPATRSNLNPDVIPGSGTMSWPLAMGSAHAEAGPSHQLGRLGKVTTCIITFLLRAMHEGADNACGHNVSHSVPCKCLTPSMAECPGSNVLDGSELHFQANPSCLPAGICNCHL